MNTLVPVQDLLPSLPQMFPGVQLIPLERIRSNPDNPGAPVTDEMVDPLAANIAEAGLLNPIKLMADPAAPLAPGVAIHPENPRLAADGRPLTVADFNYLNLCGELRYRAFQKLSRTAIPAYVLAPSPEEAVVITRLDNLARDRGWWADYQTVENLIKANPSLTQDQIGTKLKMAKPRVNRALHLLPLLNPEARGLISTNSTNSNKGIKAFSEMPAFQLAALGPGTGLKPGARKKEPVEGESAPQLWPYPAIPSETLALVRRALGVAIDHRMTEGKAKSFVAWIQQGNQPEDYATKEPQEPAPDPYAAHWPTLAPGIKVKRKAGGYHIQMTVPDGSLAWNAASAAFNVLKGQPLSAGGSVPAPALSVSPPKVTPGTKASGRWNFLSEIAGNILWKEVRQMPGHVLNRVFPGFTRIFHKKSSGVQRLGVKNQVWAAFITLFLILMVGSFLISLATRLLTWGVYRIVYSGQVMSNLPTAMVPPPQVPATAAPKPQVEGQALLVPGQRTTLTASPKGPGTAAPKPQVEGRALPVPGQGTTLTASPKGPGNPQTQASKPVTVYAPAPKQQDDPTGKILGQAVSTVANDGVSAVSKKIFGF